jgi:phosphoribosylformylglycinamidine (FGAM) synthase-like enzyme
VAFHAKTAGLPPRLDVKAERALHDALRFLIRQGSLSSAHDCSEGGLLVTLAESCMMAPEKALGAKVKLLPGSVPLHAFCFGEDASRAVVSFSPAQRPAVEAACAKLSVPLALVGTVGGVDLVVDGVLNLPVAQLSRAYRSGVPALLGKR